MQADNQDCFSQPHWRVIAQGFQPESWFEDGQAVGTGGIESPQPVRLMVGHRYYRFASSTSSRAAQLGGGWWISFEDFKTISNFAKDNGYGLSEAARLFLALPYSWTRVDRLVSAFLARPLKAYAGRGKVANSPDGDPREAGTKWIPIQHIKVTQLYIPGLYRTNLPPEDAAQPYKCAFPDAEVEFVHGNRKTV